MASDNPRGGTLSAEATEMILRATQTARLHDASLKRDDRGEGDPQNNRVRGR